MKSSRNHGWRLNTLRKIAIKNIKPLEIDNAIKPFPTTLSDMLKEAVGIHKSVRSDGIIYKRFPQNKTGKFTDDEMDYLVENSIPY